MIKEEWLLDDEEPTEDDSGDTETEEEPETEPVVDLPKLRTIINTYGFDVSNISDLATRPEMNAGNLKEAFDKNVDVLIDAIDDNDVGFTRAIFASMGEAGQGNMMSTVYGTNRSDPQNNQAYVDHARYADTTSAYVENETLYIG